MKRKLFVGLLMASLLTVIGCGKDNNSGGGNNNGYLPISANPNLSGSAQQSLQDLVRWYHDPAQQGYPGNVRGTIYEFRLVTKCDSMLGGFLSLCTPKSADREIQIQPNQSKSANVKLAQALQNPAGYELSNVTQQGSIYVLKYRKPFNFQHYKEYTIDTNKHSSVNPIKILDTEAKIEEQHQNLHFHPYYQY